MNIATGVFFLLLSMTQFDNMSSVCGFWLVVFLLYVAATVASPPGKAKSTEK